MGVLTMPAMFWACSLYLDRQGPPQLQILVQIQSMLMPTLQITGVENLFLKNIDMP